MPARKPRADSGFSQLSCNRKRSVRVKQCLALSRVSVRCPILLPMACPSTLTWRTPPIKTRVDVEERRSPCAVVGLGALSDPSL